MKRFHEEENNERKSKVKITSILNHQVNEQVITLDETIGSHLLLHKFKYLTSEIQLLLQNVPLLHKCPLDIVGTINNPGIDACIFSAVLRNNLVKTYNTISTCFKILFEVRAPDDRESLSTCLLERIYFLRYLNECDFKHTSGGIEKQKRLKLLLEGLLDDELFVLKVLREDVNNLLFFVSYRLRDKENVVLAAMKYNKHSIKYASERLKNDQEFIQKSNIENEIEIALEEILKNKKTLYGLPRYMKDIDKVVLQAVKRFGTDLKYASNRLRDDEQIVLEAVKQNGNVLEYASKRLKDNENVYVIQCASNRLKDNEQFMLNAVKKNPYAFKYASNRLKDNEEITLEAIKKDIDLLNSASDRLKDNEMIILEGVKTNHNALQYASNRLKDDETFFLQVLKYNIDSIKYASKRLKDNEQFMLQLIEIKGEILKYSSERLQDNEEIVLQAVKQNGDLLTYASKRLTDNDQIVLTAVKQNVLALQYASNSLRRDLTIVKEISNSHQCLDVFQYVGDESRNIDFIYNAMQNHHSLRNNYKIKNHQSLSKN